MRKVLMTRLCSCPADRFLSKRNRRSGWRVAGFRDQGFTFRVKSEPNPDNEVNPKMELTLGSWVLVKDLNSSYHNHRGL